MSLRDLLLAGFIAIILPFAFRYAFIGVLTWTWVGMMNPHKLTWGFMFNAPVAVVVAAVTLIALYTTRDRVKLPAATPLVFIGLFAVWTCLTTANAIFVPESITQLQKVLKIQLFLFVTAAVLYKFEHIRLYIWVNVLSLAFYGVKGGIYTIRTGGSGMVLGPPGGFIAPNTEVALALVMVIPLMYFLWLTTPHTWLKRALLVAIALTAVAALGTQSRGALLALAAMAAVLWWRAPHKFLNIIILAVLASSIWAFMPDSWHTRMGTIQTYEEDGSAMGRIYAWQTATNIASDRVMGAGYGMYNHDIRILYAPDSSDSRFDVMIPRAAHSIYFQTLGEHGYIGLFFFTMIWITAWFLAARLRRDTRNDPEALWVHHLSSMIQVSFAGWLVGGAFLSLAYWDFPYHLVVILIVAQRWLKERSVMPAVHPPVPPENLNEQGIIQRILWYIRTA